MKYYIAKGPLKRFGYKWIYSYYKMCPGNYTEVVRFYSNGRIVNNTIGSLNPDFISHYCKEITEEEYESILEL